MRAVRVVIIAIVAAVMLTACGMQNLRFTLPNYGKDTPTTAQQAPLIDRQLSQEISSGSVFPQTTSLRVEPATSINSLLPIIGGWDPKGAGGAWYQYLRKLGDSRAGTAPSIAPLYEMTSPDQRPSQVCLTQKHDDTAALRFPAICVEQESDKIDQAKIMVPYGFQGKVDSLALGTNSPVLKAMVTSLLYAEYLRQELPQNAKMYWPATTLNAGLDDCVAGITLRALVPAGMDDQVRSAFDALSDLDAFADPLLSDYALLGYQTGDMRQCV